ncbi:Outer membrane protein ArfA [Cedecea lapagei]|uniref:Outer membrane protein ArfA n=1 Tax=Cedecea lapagei TaxID=158823 RepID=A0A447V656_9ENTR|nr:OmpA family protein [Cedecea lapagei]VEC00466.1 Outer membrane protein ArfA [Cedecea lapagei]
MVKSEALFCRLVSVDTLFSFDGIIPSAPDFQLRLISLIEQLNKALLAESQTPEESEALCRALCCYFDKRLSGNAQNNSLSWQRYSLVQYFYGFVDSDEDLSLSAQLDALLNADSETIFRYAWKLLTLTMQIEGSTDALVSLRAAKRARYFSRARPELPPAEHATASWVSQQAEAAGSPRLMIFVIGPFAGKWFSQSNLSSGSESGILWVIEENANGLAKRMAYLKKNHITLATMAYFPLLADGFESSSIMIEQITAWQYAFSSIHLSDPLPCMLGLYTRLSQQRFPHDPDRAIWTGGLAEPPYGHLKLEQHWAKLLAELDANDEGKDLYAIQRHAVANTLLSWLAESRIMNVIQTLFDSTQLDFAGMTLADHGQGFTRHGAWSLWLSERYGILPGLSASIALPPLPAIPLPPVEEPAPTPSPLPEPEPIKFPRRRRWPKVVTSLALLLILAGGIGYSLFYDRGEIRGQLSRIKPLQGLLEQKDKSEAEAFLKIVNNAALFENGSSNLMPDSQQILTQLVPDIARNPQQMYLIIGHSDNTGSAAVNMALSTERARVIRDWLVEHSGLAASQFIVEGAGNSRPIASNATQEGRAQNRRVEIIPLSMQDYKD